MTKVALKELSKRFNDTVVVDDIDLEIEDKEFVVFVGPSGCGKSTTLRMIAGLEEPTSGEILIDGEVVTDMAPKDRNIAMVFQNYALYPHMNVSANMGFGLKMRGVAKEEIARRVHWGAGVLGIEPLLTRRPKQLSGGQRQRVALGRAIVREPKVFLLDEPLSNLDAKLRVQMRSEIIKLHNRLNATMIYVTHDQVEAMSMGDRIVVMSDGKIQQVGTPMDVYEHPLNLFVAGFVGSRSMNFIDAVLRGTEGSMRAEFGPNEISVPADRYVSVAPGDRPVTLGIRPEQIYVGENGFRGKSRSRAVPARVEVAEPLGSTIILELSAEGGSFVAEVTPDVRVHIGELVDVFFDESRIHLFDTESGRTLSALKWRSSQPVSPMLVT